MGSGRFETQIPIHMMEAIKRYVDHGIPPGGFLTAIICNDLIGAVTRADEDNLQIIPAYALYFWWEAPSECHGSPDIMAAWMYKKSDERAAKTALATA